MWLWNWPISCIQALGVSYGSGLGAVGRGESSPDGASPSCGSPASDLRANSGDSELWLASNVAVSAVDSHLIRRGLVLLRRPLWKARSACGPTRGGQSGGRTERSRGQACVRSHLRLRFPCRQASRGLRCARYVSYAEIRKAARGTAHLIKWVARLPQIPAVPIVRRWWIVRLTRAKRHSRHSRADPREKSGGWQADVHTLS